MKSVNSGNGYLGIEARLIGNLVSADFAKELGLLGFEPRTKGL
jgi:hypothetical protein